MDFVLDTNILIYYLRDYKTKEFIETTFDPLSSANTPIISIVTVGEIRSIAKRNNWGQKRWQLVEELMNQLVVTDIKYEPILDAYAAIDAYSQGKLTDKSLPMSARNMGKNDLWIAATASVAEAILITADSDFQHLDDEFLNVIKIDL